jgi:HEAT repeats/Carboxypeptidase regulatory-like domain
MKASHAVPCLLVLFGVSLAAQTKTTRFRGTVEDANTKKPIAGATVSASGDTGQQAEITDDNGFFRLVIEGVAPGDLVRLRVVKTGYTVYDRQVVASEEIPITVDLHRSASAAVSGSPHTPSVWSDPVTARYIEELNTQQNPLFRLNALEVVVRSAAKDSVALDAVAAAVNDADYRVRQTAAYDLGKIGQPTSKVITALRIALDDPEPLVQHSAMDALGKLSSNKEALDALFDVMGAPPNVNL